MKIKEETKKEMVRTSMILGAKVENFAGIKNFKVDFRQKHNQKKEQILVDGDSVYSQFPTFLAKNATRKTSFIKALDFTLSFASKGQLAQELKLFVSRIRRRIIEWNHGLFNESGERPTEAPDHHQYIKELIGKVHTEVSYIGTNNTIVEVNLSNSRNIKIIFDHENFIFVCGKKTYNLEKILLDIVALADIGNIHPRTETNLSKVIDDYVSMLDIYDDVIFSAIFRDTARITQMNEINVKHKSNSYILKIVDQFGFEAFSTLIHKLDRNIAKVDWNVEQKNINIYIKDSEMPISATNLSFGTLKTLEIISKSLDMFKSGGAIMIDEIENGLHLSLIKLLVSFFEDKSINSGGAQLLLTTHNPLLAERGIIHFNNIYMAEGSTFVSIKEIKGNNRSEDKEKLIKSKNYYNDLFWIRNEAEIKSTISNVAISQIINSFIDGVTWQK